MPLHPLNDDAKQAEKRTRSMIYAQRHDPANVRCESIVRGEDGDPCLCGKPADYTHARRFRDAGHYWWRHHPICESCASNIRRIEIDYWLDEIGAQVIQVEDLGAALEADEQGRHGAFVAGLAAKGKSRLLYAPKSGPMVVVFPNYVYEIARSAAHLARVALGEV